MKGKEFEPQLSPELLAFKKKYTEALINFADIAADYAVVPMSPDPLSIVEVDIDDMEHEEGEEIDEEPTFDQLSDDELRIVKQALWEVFEINGADPETLQRTYVTEAPNDADFPGPINVSVLKTNREDVYLHELTYTGNPQVRWMIGPRDVDA